MRVPWNFHFQQRRIAMSNDSFSIFVQHKMHLLQKLYDSHFQFEEDHLEATIHFRFFCSKYYIHLYMQDFCKFRFQRLNDEAFAMIHLINLVQFSNGRHLLSMKGFQIDITWLSDFELGASI